MSLIHLVLVLALVGFLLWALNNWGRSFIDGKILSIINIVVVVVVVLWLFALLFGITVPDIYIGRRY